MPPAARRRPALLTALALAAGLGAGLAPPLAAQEAACAGAVPGAAWFGGSEALADPGAAPAALVLPGLAVPAGGVAGGRFRLAAPATLRLEARPAPGGDSVLELYESGGRMLVTDDDSGGDLAARVEIDLAPGTYCLAARGFAGAAHAVDLSVGRLEHAALTTGLAGGFTPPGGGLPEGPLFVGIQPCTAATPATDLGAGAPIDALLAQGGARANGAPAAVPYYRFDLAQPQALSIRAANPAADPYIYLFDATGALLAENDDYDSLDSRIDLTTPLPAGRYCLGMRALADPALPVTVSILPYDARTASAEAIRRGETAPPLDGSWLVTAIGPLPARAVRDLAVTGGDARWLSFEIDTRGVVVIDAAEVTDSDPMIAVFAESGAALGFNDDANGSLNSQLLLRLDPGRYLLAVMQYSEGYRGVIRLSTERFVPAP